MRLKPRYRAGRYRASGKLEGRAALITGGDSEIDRAMALLYAREGADIAIVHLPEEQVDVYGTARAGTIRGKALGVRW